MKIPQEHRDLVAGLHPPHKSLRGVMWTYQRGRGLAIDMRVLCRALWRNEDGLVCACWRPRGHAGLCVSYLGDGDLREPAI